MSFGTPQAGASKPLFSFGSTTPAQSTGTSNTAAPSGFSFGGASTTNASSTPGTSTLFGAKPAVSNPFTGFGQQQQGSTTGTTGTTSTSQPFSFGKPAAAPVTTGSAPAPFGGFKLGQSTTTGQAQPFSFGTQSTSAAPATSGGFSFGQTQPAQQQQQQNQPFQLGQQQQLQQSQQGQQQQQSGLGVTSSGAPITNQTRFEELPQELKSYIESLESHIRGRIAIYDELKSERLGAGIHDTSALLRQLRTAAAGLSTNLAHDSRDAQALQRRYMQAGEDAQRALGTVDAFGAPQGSLNPQQQHQQAQMQQFQFPKPPPNFLPDFFRRRTEEMSERLAVYKSSIEQVQSQLGRSDPDQVKAILPTLRSQHQATLQLASKLAALEGAVNELKAEYTHLWRERTNSIRDPFLDRRREILGHDQAITESIGGMSLR